MVAEACGGRLGGGDDGLEFVVHGVEASVVGYVEVREVREIPNTNHLRQSFMRFSTDAFPLHFHLKKFLKKVAIDNDGLLSLGENKAPRMNTADELPVLMLALIDDNIKILRMNKLFDSSVGIKMKISGYCHSVFHLMRIWAFWGLLGVEGVEVLLFGDSEAATGATD